MMLAPLAVNAEEAIGSMGNDTPLAALSNRRPLLYSYFKQLFAQVTNPPIDSTREAVVMSVQSLVGSERNLLDETPEHARQLVIENPILRDDELESLRQVDSDIFKARTLDITWPVEDGADGLESALDRVCADADDALDAGANILVLSDRAVGAARAPIPSLLAVGAVHHHLVRSGTRLQTGLVVESGEPRSVQSVAVLIGYGAAAVNPYLMLATIGQLVDEGRIELPRAEAEARAVKAIGKGLLKVISKMGISTISSYCGAQVFEAVGLSPRLIERYFTGHAVAHRRDRPRRGRRGRARPACARVSRAPPATCCRWSGSTPGAATASTTSGTPRRSRFCSTPSAAAAQPTYDEFAATVNADSARRSTLRGLLRFRPARRRRHPARRGRARGGDRQALLDGRDVARLALARGARDARGRDEPHRRPLEHRRGRRGSRALHATSAARRSSRSRRAASASTSTT